LKPAIGVCTPPIDPYLTAADQTVDMGLGDTSTKPDQKIVESLSIVILINSHQRGGRAGGGSARV
jgi:hypothetical protein